MKHHWKQTTLLLNVIFLTHLSLATLANPVHPQSTFAAGSGNTCIVEEDGVYCWGKDAARESSQPKQWAQPKLIVLGIGLGCATHTDAIEKIRCWGNGLMENAPTNFDKVFQLSGIAHHVCALGLVSGQSKIQCWGANQSEQSDVPTTTATPLKIAAGGSHSCALYEQQHNRFVKCWGKNDFGQSSVPEELRDPIDVVVGNNHTCILTESKEVFCQGTKESNEKIVPPLNEPTRLIGGPNNTCAWTKDGWVCWGRADSGLLKIPSDIQKHESHLSIGVFHACAITRHSNPKKLVCWGENRFGEATVPEAIHPQQLRAGRHSACVIDGSDRKVKCWGNNWFGQNDEAAEFTQVDRIEMGQMTHCLYQGTQLTCVGPERDNENTFPPGFEMPKKLSLGTLHKCVINSADAPACWGWNAAGQSDIPSIVSQNKVTDIVASYVHSCAVIEVEKGLSQASCWGGKEYQQLNIPTDLAVPNSQNLHSLHSNSFHTCGLTGTFPNNQVRCWGLNNHGQIEEPKISRILQVSPGEYSTCALYLNNESKTNVLCWGSDKYDQTIVPELQGETLQLASGKNFHCALTRKDNQNKVQCWGASIWGTQIVPRAVKPKSPWGNNDRFFHKQTEAIKK